MAVVLEDGITASPDQSKLPYGNSVRPLLAASATTPVLPPDDPSVLVTTRVGPPVLGRGYMEAVDDKEIERVEAEQAKRTDAIHGRINRVTYASEPNPDGLLPPHSKGETALIGRFGLKARIATLDEFTADALQGDMGVTSPMRPDELPNPDGLLDDRKAGPDASLATINTIAGYLRLIAVPDRKTSARGEALFEEVQCAACHVPTLATRADYPIEALAGIDAAVFTDFLLHDMGPKLADGLADGSADSRRWRTAPLIGLRFDATFLHDGRAATIEDAILAHGDEGSEARGSVSMFEELSNDDRAALLAYVGAL
jgi:CxxC motif-containing protein (DUF1111 family)